MWWIIPHIVHYKVNNTFFVCVYVCRQTWHGNIGQKHHQTQQAMNVIISRNTFRTHVVSSFCHLHVLYWHYMINRTNCSNLTPDIPNIYYIRKLYVRLQKLSMTCHLPQFCRPPDVVGEVVWDNFVKQHQTQTLFITICESRTSLFPCQTIGNTLQKASDAAESSHYCTWHITTKQRVGEVLHAPLRCVIPKVTCKACFSEFTMCDKIKEKMVHTQS